MYEEIKYSLFSYSPFIITRNVTSKVAPNSSNSKDHPTTKNANASIRRPVLTEEVLKNEEKELDWFSGFSEAESMFFISKDGYLKFKIKLHHDDRPTLVYIQKLLSRLANRTIGVIVDSKNDHESYYSIDKFQDIVEIINPIFIKYHFTTSKYLDFIDFKEAANIKIISFLAKRKLNDQELQEILKLKSGMNTLRVCFNPKDLPKRPITPRRLLGFIEGDGSFCLPNMEPTLAIKQHAKNIHFFYDISEFLSNLPFRPNIGPATDVADSKPKPGIYDANNYPQASGMSSLSVFNILQLYNYILPFFKSLELKSRKAEDFRYWEAAVNIKALGYATQPEGRKYLMEIAKYINKRYSSNLEMAKAPDMEGIKKLLKTPPIFDLTSGLTYKILSDLEKISLQKGGNRGYGVNVYDGEELLKGSPFPSYTKAALALGNINISSIISKKIDTNKLYKQRFKFESACINSDTISCNKKR